MIDHDLPGPWTFHGTQRHDGRDAWCWRAPDGQTLLIVPAFPQAPGAPTPMSLVGHNAETYHSEGRIRVRFTPTVLIGRIHLPYPAPDAVPGLLDALLRAQRPEATQAAYDALTAAAEAWCLATMSTWIRGRHPSARATLNPSDASWTLEVTIGDARERPKTRVLPPAATAFFRPVSHRRVLVFPEVPDRPRSAHDRIAAAAWAAQTRDRLTAAFDAAAWAPKEEMRRQFLRDLARLTRWAG
jgi:hypothetical protein